MRIKKSDKEGDVTGYMLRVYEQMNWGKVLARESPMVSIDSGFLVVVGSCSYVERGQLTDISIKI